MPAGIVTDYDRACISIANYLLRADLVSLSLPGIIKEHATNYHLSTLPRYESILRYLPEGSPARVILMRKPAKTASGVAIIAIMPKPYECPHGRCIYCPGGIEYNTPLSYMGSEPSTKTAQKYNYDPYFQVKTKLDQLRTSGHDVGKVELVIVGGTFPFMPLEYQYSFVKSCFDALNNEISPDLFLAMKNNETSLTRCVGFTVETKPDYCQKVHVDNMLAMGMTRVEIGIQTLQEDIYRLVNRGHNLNDVVQSFKVSKDSGLKIVAHMMPGLPGSTPKQDLDDFVTLFSDSQYKPDMLKIYPTLVIKNTGLYRMYKRGDYQPYTNEEFIDLLIKIKKIAPPWLRIMRVQREIESTDIEAGPKDGNLRQLVLLKMKKEGYQCRCIRCREAGLQKKFPPLDEVKMFTSSYESSDGNEIFISFETKDRNTILGFIRLRIPGDPHRTELSHKTAIVRELHVYGQVLNIGAQKSSLSYQHRGFGRRLMGEAELICTELGMNKLAIISAVGTRKYYERLGYSRDGPYMAKVL